MIGALIIAAILIAAVVLLVRHTRRMPKMPDHERDQERFRDPAITAYKGGPGGGV